MSTMAMDSVRRHRLTVANYYRMAEAGILRADARVELIEGEIIDMAPIGRQHAGTVNHLNRILQQVVGEHAIVQIQNPVSLDEYSEPEPDVALLRPRADFYKSGHPQPQDVLLIIEVADTSSRYDREVKVPLYARHGIGEVWVLDLEGGNLTRYRDPREGSYARIDRPDLRSPIAIEALPDLRLALGPVLVD